MDKNADFRKFREAILTFEDCPNSPVAKEAFHNWRHYCFSRYPTGEVLKFLADTYADIGENARSEWSKFPRRWTKTQEA